ncbi:thiolase C-terminal domain-containing protein [Pusillimonas noertemannii]|uniref:Acetyl-CoA acetyltransferase n=1 Tax=Pusillimonas noertemannii TaxID=305977 RepID=A0A2U1CKZ5_9BURK|nr:thiolase [Pusillimonas noertemannii]NYT69217.1 thiolase [Pusillimonas noertemannii]PVY61686.1 acetyl-CoA acetyltransferase [Pusillimonas noertemannii]TFL09626.1 thiolase [Pusillimonas noertemannii]
MNARIAVVGAAESTNMGVIEDLSQLGIAADASLNAVRDAGISLSDIDGIAIAGEAPASLAHYLGIQPTWLDGTSVGGCSFLMHVRHAAAAIASGLCKTVLVAHGESGKSRIAATGLPWPPPPSSLAGQFEAPFGAISSPTMFTLPVLKYLHEHGLGLEALAHVVVAQRKWAAQNPRALYKEQISVEEVLAARMIAYPFTRPMCCPLTDGGGALILVAAEKAKDMAERPVYVIGTGESSESPLISQMPDLTSSGAFKRSGAQAFSEANICVKDVDHVMIYDAFAHLPLYGLEALGFCAAGEAAGFIAEGNTAPGGSLPVNTNGGGLSYMHSGMYGMYAMQESVRQLRGRAPAQLADPRISVCHGVGGMFATASTIIFSTEASV